MFNQIIVVCFSGILGGIIGATLSYIFNRKLENIRREQLVKDKAAIVAELLATWHTDAFDVYKCTKLSYELSLYLPADLYSLLAMRLSNDPNSLHTKDILIKIREHLLGNKDALTAQTIVHWNEQSRFDFGQSKGKKA